MADEEEWTLARRQENIEEVRGPVVTLIRSARASRRDTAVAAWATQVRTLADNMVVDALHVIDDQSMEYTLVEMDEVLQLLS